MVLSVGCSSGSKLSSEEEQMATRFMEGSQYMFDNSFAMSETFDADFYANIIPQEDIQKMADYIMKTEDSQVVLDKSTSELMDSLFNLMVATKNLGVQRINDGVEKGDKETSEEYQNFVEKFNEVNEKYKLGFDEL